MNLRLIKHRILRSQRRFTMSGHSENKQKRIMICALLIGLLIGQADTYANVLAQTSRDAHRHPKLSDMRKEILPGVDIAEVVLDKSAAKENRVRSRDGSYEAFTSDKSDEPGIYFVERRTGKVFEVRGLPLPYRPFSDLAWINNWTLQFDRWSQPHYGIHYVVNVKTKKLVSASGFPDKFELEHQRSKSAGRNSSP
jgi:hypothetical protein